jgi:IgA-specific serine endopeptidase
MYQLNIPGLNVPPSNTAQAKTFPIRAPKQHERLFRDLILAYNRSLTQITDGKKSRATESDTSRELIERLAELTYTARDIITGERLVLSPQEEQELEAARIAEEEAKARAIREELEAAAKARAEAEAREKAAEKARAELAEQLRLESIAQEIRKAREHLVAADRKEGEKLSAINKQIGAALAAVEAEAKQARLEAEAEAARLAAEQAKLAAEAEQARLTAKAEQARLAAEQEKARLEAELAAAAQKQPPVNEELIEALNAALERAKTLEEEKDNLAKELKWTEDELCKADNRIEVLEVTLVNLQERLAKLENKEEPATTKKPPSRQNGSRQDKTQKP